MPAFGNIVSKTKVDADPSLFNVTDSLEKCIPGIPTLIIGLDNAKAMIPGFSILEKDYGDKHWTYSKTERRCDYEDDLDNFCGKSLLTMLNSKGAYKYIDFTSFGVKRASAMLEFARNRMKKTVFLTKGASFAFIYISELNTVFGLSLSMCEYLGIPKGKALKRIRNAEYVRDTFFMEHWMRKAIGSDTHMIPVLYEILKK